MIKWENPSSGYADKPVESQQGGQETFQGLYIKSPLAGEAAPSRTCISSAVPARFSQNLTSSVTHPNLEIMDERLFLPRWPFSIFMQMQRHGMEQYPTYVGNRNISLVGIAPVGIARVPHGLV
jgi:hypothetical protein